MNDKVRAEDDSTEKVTIVERALRAVKATIALMVYRHILTRDELHVTGKAKMANKDLESRLSKLAWVFETLVSALEEKHLIDVRDTEMIYSLRRLRKNPNRAAGLAAGEFAGALRVLLDCLIHKNLITKQEATEILKSK